MNEHPKYLRLQDLPPERREKVEFLENLLRKASGFRSVRAWVITISANCHKNPSDGFSVPNLQKLYHRWEISGNDWRILDKYNAQETDNAWLLKRHGLSPERIKKWLKRGEAIKLAKKHNISPSIASDILNGKRAPRGHAGFVADVAREIFGVQKAAQLQLAEYELCVRRVQKPLRLMLARIRKLRRAINPNSQFPQ